MRGGPTAQGGLEHGPVLSHTARSMRVHESPVWRVATYDFEQKHGEVSCGEQRAVVENFDEPDLEPGERVFVSLREVGFARRIWPAVSHLDLTGLPARQVAEAPEWLPITSKLLDGLPYPLEATALVGPEELSLVSYSWSPNAYVPWEADVSILGELVLRGVQYLSGNLSGGRLAFRVATRRERSSLPPHSDEARVIVVGDAEHWLGHSGRRRASVACIADEVVWLPHRADDALIEKALTEFWTRWGAPEQLTVEDGRVWAHHPNGAHQLGQLELRAARRWVTAHTDLLRSEVSATLP